MERCPNCRARWDGGETCRRCGMDLAPLLAVEQAAEDLAARATAQLLRGDTAAAVRTLGHAEHLSGEVLVRCLRGFAETLAAEPGPPSDGALPP